MRPVQFFKNNADHRRRRSATVATAAVVGQFLFPRTMASILQKFWIIYDDRRGEKKARLACNPLLGPWTLQGVTAYKAKHTYIEALWYVCVYFFLS